MQPIITLFCAFARDTFTKKWLDDLSTFKHDITRTRIVIIVDGDFSDTIRKLREYFKGKPYASVQIEVNRDHNPNDQKINIRRARIAFIKNQSKYIIKKWPSEYVLGLEDDSAFGDLDVADLLFPFTADQGIGYVTGVECGRYGVKYLGIWKADDVHDPKEVTSITPVDVKQHIEIDAGGFYYYLTPTKLYCEHEYSWGHEQWGADVNYGLWVRQQGYRCIAHLPSLVGHRTYDETIYPYDEIVEVKNYKVGDEWLRKDTVKASPYAQNKTA